MGKGEKRDAPGGATPDMLQFRGVVEGGILLGLWVM